METGYADCTFITLKTLSIKSDIEIKWGCKKVTKWYFKKEETSVKVKMETFVLIINLGK